MELDSAQNGRPAAALQRLLEDCVVRIPDRGTGFFVASGLVLTCAHLFNPKNADQPWPNVSEVIWQGQTYPVKIRLNPQPEHADLALLVVESDGIDRIRGHPCVMLDHETSDLQSGTSGDTFYTSCHPEGIFESQDSERFVYVGPSRDEHQRPYQRVSGGQASAGFSGAPMLNLRTGLVDGMLAISINPN